MSEMAKGLSKMVRELETEVSQWPMEERVSRIKVLVPSDKCCRYVK